jgi:hypothetical protein
MDVKIDTTYEVSQGDVTLTIKIGDAQLGASIVKLEEKELGIGKIENLQIGKGPDIAGKTLSIKSIVSDVNDKTNHTSICYVLKGGKVDKEYDLGGTVDEEGASIIYRAKFQLKS